MDNIDKITVIRRRRQKLGKALSVLRARTRRDRAPLSLIVMADGRGEDEMTVVVIRDPQVITQFRLWAKLKGLETREHDVDGSTRPEGRDACPRCGSDEVREARNYGRATGEQWCTDCGRRW